MSAVALDARTAHLDGRRLIEASAGTGKTYTIADLYLRLLLERDLGVQDILVVTFTEAATEELRGRIRKRLRSALDACRGQGGEDRMLEHLLAHGVAAEVAEQRLGGALTQMDEAAIFTIHGYCYRTLREQAFECGADFDAELVTDAEQLSTTIIEDYWRRKFYPRGRAYLAWLQAHWSTPAALYKELRGHVSTPDLRLWPELPDDRELGAQAAQARATLRALWQREGAALLQRVGELVGARQLSSAKDKGFSDQAREELRSGLDAHLAEPPEGPLPAVANRFTPQGMGAAVTKAGQKVGLDIAAHPLLAAMQAYLDSARLERMRIIREALAWLCEELDRRKRERGLLSLDDLLARLEAALTDADGTGLAETLARRYPVALVDEFQDTDPRQYRIFSTIYDHGRGTLLMIGDPKQAIYAFRGADIFTYISARRDAHPPHYTLGTNWRSTERMVRAVNTLFGRAARPFVYDGDIDFQPVTAAGRALGYTVDGVAADGLTVWQHPRPEGAAEKGMAKKQAEPEIASATAADIARLLHPSSTARLPGPEGPRAPRPEDIAVLVRDRYQAARIQQALAAVGIASVFLSRESVFQSETATELLRLLEALARPADEARLRAALTTRLMGEDASALHAELSDDARWEQRMNAALRAHQDWRRLGVLPMLHGFLHQGQVIARLRGQPDGERRLTDLLQLAELLQLAASDCPTMDGLVDWLRSQIASPTAAGEAAEMRLESDAARVRVVTIHKSKGLQYPLVYLPFIGIGREPPSEKATKQPPVLCHPNAGPPLLDLGSDDYAHHQALQRREGLAEDLRMLYVALTRAEYACTIAWGAYKTAGETALGYLLYPPSQAGAPPPCSTLDTESLSDAQLWARLAELAEQADAAIHLRPLPEADAPTPASDAPLAPGRATPFTAHIQRDWRLTSYSGLLGGGADHGPEAPDYDPEANTPAALAPEQLEPIFAFPRGAAAGVLLHTLFEHTDFVGADPVSLSQTLEGLLARHGFESRWAQPIAGHIAGVIDTQLEPAEGLSLRAIPRRQRRDEMEFHLPLQPLHAEALTALVRELPTGGAGPRLQFASVQGMLKGYIDLVFEHRGRYYVVDYKSNHLGDRWRDYRPERLAAAMAEHRYDLQYLLYTVALHRLLRQRLPGYRYDAHVGGVHYLFLRGMRPDQGPATGVYSHRPDAALIERLDALLGQPAGGEA